MTVLTDLAALLAWASFITAVFMCNGKLWVYRWAMALGLAFVALWMMGQ